MGRRLPAGRRRRCRLDRDVDGAAGTDGSAGPDADGDLLSDKLEVLDGWVVFEDPTNPDHHAVLAGIYSSLALAGIDGAQERAEASLAEAQRLDPLNPAYRLIAAQMAVRRTASAN